MKILKTKQGFTLIELLVVIGILAVLAAIAIPSVAGLIDRANVSADATNANEMTNAVERFTSEYELYLQDIASGKLDTTNLDSAQGRVYNVTGVTDRAGIEALEKDATAGVDTTGKAIYRDTKYPVNAETMQAVVENYMKTSSTTFTPKQSDCHYYYSPDCGLVVCTETEKSDVTDLNALVQSGKDAKGKNLSDTTKWIDLTNEVSIDNSNNNVVNCCSEPDIETYKDDTKCKKCGTVTYGANTHSGIIPENATYVSLLEQKFEYMTLKYDKIETLTSGQPFPSTVHNGDYYLFEDYKYVLYRPLCEVCYTTSCSCKNATNGWAVTLVDKTKTSYSDILESINDINITDMNATFTMCNNVTEFPEIPKYVSNISFGFAYCPLAEKVPTIHNNIEQMSCAFYSSQQIKGIITINTNPINYSHAFNDVDFQKQNITLAGTSTLLNSIGLTGLNYCTNCNGYCSCGTFTH